MDMEKILVPTDFSKCADNAIDFALQMAACTPMDLSLVNVVEFYPATFSDPAGFPLVYPGPYFEDVKKMLEELAANLQKRQMIHIDTEIYDLPVSSGIEQAVREKHPDVIVMGTHGASGLQKALWGSQTGSVISRSTIPVIAVPCNYKGVPKKLLFATNNFEKKPAILEFLLDLVRCFNAELHIVVFTDQIKDKAVDLVEHQYKLQAYGEMITNRFGKLPITAHIHGDDLLGTLNSYIHDNGVDMLAMVTHQRNLFQRIFHRSATMQMSYHSSVPLVAIPDKKRKNQ